MEPGDESDGSEPAPYGDPVEHSGSANMGTPKQTAEVLWNLGTTWMNCTVQYGERTIQCFADTGASRNFMSKARATKLGLFVRPPGIVITLPGGKFIFTKGTVRYTFTKGDFKFEEEYHIIDMEYDVILGKPFWELYEARPDYKCGGLIVYDHGKEVHLGPTVPLSCELEEGESLRWMSDRGVAKAIKDDQVEEIVLWMIRDGIDSTKEGEERTTGDPELDLMLKPLWHCFRTELPETLPPKRWVDHEIDTGDAKAVNRPPYSLSVQQLEEQEKQVQYLQKRGLIRPSTSSWGAPVIFVRKKDKTWRMCIDYRALNAVTVRNTYPLPRIDECLDQLHGASYFTKLDLLSGYWQILIKEADRRKTAFNTQTGKWEFCVLPFGLTNAPSTFQKMMNDILREFFGKFVIVYIDDILIYSKTRKEHIQHVRQVFQKLSDNNLFLKLSKCFFLRRTMEFCGFVVGGGVIRMDMDKVRTIDEWPRPVTVYHVRSFVGLCSYYRKFIKEFAAITCALYDLIRQAPPNRKHHHVRWNAATEAAFIRLKQVMKEDPVLLQPNLFMAFIIETDASDFAWDAVLIQIGDDGLEHPVAYESHAFNQVERRYPTHERELLAIKTALKKWHRYIDNGTRTIVRCDHEGLQYMKTVRKPSQKLARWIEEFSYYDVDIQYKPGKEMIVADALSRRADFETLNLLSTYADYMEDFLTNQTLPEDPELAEEVRTKATDFTYEDGILMYQRKDGECVPYIQLIDRVDMIERIHREIGHASANTIIDLIVRRGWWPKMEEEIRHYVRHCQECQLTKRVKDRPTDELHPNAEWRGKVQPFERWGLDLIGKLPRTPRGNIWIVTAIDYATGWPVAKALPEATAVTLAEFVHDEIYMHYGQPREVLTDRGPNLWKEAMAIFMNRMGTKRRGTTPYHPRTNGKVERLNGIFGQSISKYLVGKPRKMWDLYLAPALFHARVRTHTTTEFSAFYTLYGVQPRLVGDETGPTPETDETRSDPAGFLETVRAEAARRTEFRNEQNKQYFKSNVRKLTFKVGDWVLLRAGNPKKWEAKFYGPYKVSGVEFANTYELQKPTGQRHSTLVHGDRLHRARVEGRLTRGWRMPGRRGRPPRTRDHGSENNPDHPIAAAIEDFEDIPSDVDGDSGGEF